MDDTINTVSTKDWLKASEGMTFSAHDSSSRGGSSAPVEADDFTKKVSKQALRKVSGGRVKGD